MIGGPSWHFCQSSSPIAPPAFVGQIDPLNSFGTVN
ncbi:hypothetical protein LINPERHAP2_LOCUS17749 [Linum perenne]